MPFNSLLKGNHFIWSYKISLYGFNGAFSLHFLPHSGFSTTVCQGTFSACQCSESVTSLSVCKHHCPLKVSNYSHELYATISNSESKYWNNIWWPPLLKNIFFVWLLICLCWGRADKIVTTVMDTLANPLLLLPTPPLKQLLC